MDGYSFFCGGGGRGAALPAKVMSPGMSLHVFKGDKRRQVQTTEANISQLSKSLKEKVFKSTKF